MVCLWHWFRLAGDNLTIESDTECSTLCIATGLSCLVQIEHITQKYSFYNITSVVQCIYFLGLYMVGQFGGLAFWRFQMPFLRGSPFRPVWDGRATGAARKALRQNQEEIYVLDRFLGPAPGRPRRGHVPNSPGFGGLWYLDPTLGHDGSFHPICPGFAIPLHDYGPVQKIQIVQQDPGPYHQGKSCIRL